jgi:hypothetical protein
MDSRGSRAADDVGSVGRGRVRQTGLHGYARERYRHGDADVDLYGSAFGRAPVFGMALGDTSPVAVDSG